MVTFIMNPSQLIWFQIRADILHSPPIKIIEQVSDKQQGWKGKEITSFSSLNENNRIALEILGKLPSSNRHKAEVESEINMFIFCRPHSNINWPIKMLKATTRGQISIVHRTKIPRPSRQAKDS